MKRRENDLLIPFLQSATDCVGIIGSFLLSYWLRFYSPLTNLVPVTKGFPGLEIYFWSSCVIALVWLLIFKSVGLYGARRDVRPADEVFKILKGVTLGMLILTSATFFYREFSYSRLVFGFIWIIAVILLMTTRMSILRLENRLHRKGRGTLKTAIAGSSEWGNAIYETVKRNPGLGLDIIGNIGQNKELCRKIDCLGKLDQIAELVKNRYIDVVFVALSDKESGKLVDLILKCTGLHVEFYLVPDLLELMTGRLQLKEIGGIPVLKIKETAITGWNAVFKRVFDIVFSGLSLLILWPFLLVIAAAIKLDSRGTVFYKQMRVGLDGREFDLIKFRTMAMDAEKKTGPVWAVKNDPRVTPTGRILRKTSLDELPQLINVLKGEMSMVGPRPERRHFVEQFKNKIPKYLERHRVKSGMTGWAQVNGLRGNVPIEERTKYDVYYVENWSLLLDVKIVFMTIWAVTTGKNSY